MSQSRYQRLQTNRDVLVATPTSQTPTATSQNHRQHFELNPDVSNPAPTSRNQPAATSRNQPIGTCITQRQHLETNGMFQNEPRHLETHLLEPDANLSELEPNVNMSNVGTRTRLAILVHRQCLEPNANILNPMPTCRPCLSPFLGISAPRSISVSILSLYFYYFLLTHSLFQATYEAI